MWTKIRSRHIVDGKFLTEEIYYMGDLRGINFSRDWRFRTVPTKRCQATIIEVQEHHIHMNQRVINELKFKECK